MCAATMFLCQLFPPLRIDLRWPDFVISYAVIALVLGTVATRMQKRGWW